MAELCDSRTKERNNNTQRKTRKREIELEEVTLPATKRRKTPSNMRDSSFQSQEDMTNAGLTVKASLGLINNPYLSTTSLDDSFDCLPTSDEDDECVFGQGIQSQSTSPCGSNWNITENRNDVVVCESSSSSTPAGGIRVQRLNEMLNKSKRIEENDEIKETISTMKTTAGPVFIRDPKPAQVSNLKRQKPTRWSSSSTLDETVSTSTSSSSLAAQTSSDTTSGEVNALFQEDAVLAAEIPVMGMSSANWMKGVWDWTNDAGTPPALFYRPEIPGNRMSFPTPPPPPPPPFIPRFPFHPPMMMASMPSLFSSFGSDGFNGESGVMMMMGIPNYLMNEQWQKQRRFSEGQIRFARKMNPSHRRFLPSYDLTELLRDLDENTTFIDTHCHIDFLLKRTEFKGTYSSFQKLHEATFPSCYEGCIANFCDPNTFSKSGMWREILDEPNVWGAFGCHPHHSQFFNQLTALALEQALHHPKVKALGEIGLDYSSRNSTNHDKQKEVFRIQLKLAVKMKLPLVIHSRDATTDTLVIMKEELPREYVIHRHCFTGDWEEAEMWLREFPKLFIGLTPLVTFPSATEVHNVARRIPLDRLLLETDAPYFVPPMENKNRKCSHPGLAIHVAAQIVMLRADVTFNDLLRRTRDNARKMYGI